MHRLSNGTQTNAYPSVPAVVGSPGYATSGNPAVPLAPAIIDPYQAVSIQEEIANYIEGLGVTLDKSVNNQMISAYLATLSAKVASAFTGSLTSPGWCRLPNGLIFQWGIAVLPTGGSAVSVNVTFPIVFPSLLLSIQTTAAFTANGGAYGPSTQALNGTLNGFIFRGDTLNPSISFTNGVGCFWAAIGT